LTEPNTKLRDLQLALASCVGALILILILASLLLVCSVLPTTLRPVATYFGGPLDVTEARCGWHLLGLQSSLYSASSALPAWVLVSRLGFDFSGD
jgi:hypothetical protein